MRAVVCSLDGGVWAVLEVMKHVEYLGNTDA